MHLIQPDLFPADERDDLSSINAALTSLAARRIERIDLLAEPYCRSKIAWKVATFSNAIAFRFCSLAEGVAIGWNADNMLATTLCGRALVETAAIFWEFVERFEKAAANEDFAAADNLAMSYLFGTRDEDLLRDHPELVARQVLSAIDRVDRHVVPGMRSHYDRLSEFCHPNSWGHRGLFSKTDHKTGITEFGQRKQSSFALPIKCALGTVSLLADALRRIEGQLVSFAEAHHRAHPSPAVDT